MKGRNSSGRPHQLSLPPAADATTAVTDVAAAVAAAVAVSAVAVAVGAASVVVAGSAKFATTVLVVALLLLLLLLLHTLVLRLALQLLPFAAAVRDLLLRLLWLLHLGGLCCCYGAPLQTHISTDLHMYMCARIAYLSASFLGGHPSDR